LLLLFPPRVLCRRAARSLLSPEHSKNLRVSDGFASFDSVHTLCRPQQAANTGERLTLTRATAGTLAGTGALAPPLAGVNAICEQPVEALIEYVWSTSSFARASPTPLSIGRFTPPHILIGLDFFFRGSRCLRHRCRRRLVFRRYRSG